MMFLFSGQVVRGGGDDYWAETFNSDKNCQQEKKISKLEKSDNGQCFTVVSIFLFRVTLIVAFPPSLTSSRIISS